MGDRGPMPKHVNRVEFPAAKPKMPACLDVEARKLWRRLVPFLSKAGLLTVADVESLTLLCAAWSIYQQASAVLVREGRYLASANGARYSHPAVTDQRAALQDFTRLASKFGLTPKDRERMTAPEQDNEVPTSKSRLFSTFTRDRDGDFARAKLG